MVCDQGSEMVGAPAKVALGWRALSGPSRLRVEYGQTPTAAFYRFRLCLD